MGVEYSHVRLVNVVGVASPMYLDRVVSRHNDDNYLLKLTYNAEVYCEEYYCLICKKERNPKQWFYYFAKCDFPTHSQCVLGES